MKWTLGVLAMALWTIAGCVDEAIVAQGAVGGVDGNLADGCWANLALDPPGNRGAGGAPALAIGGDRTSWIARYLMGEGGAALLQILDDSGRAWRTRTLPEWREAVVSEGDLDAALDPAGNLHVTTRSPAPVRGNITFVGEATLQHVLAREDAVEVRDVEPPIRAGANIAIAPDGTVRAVYRTFDAGEGLLPRTRLWLGTERPDGSWEVEPIYEGDVRAPTIALDPDGAPHVAFATFCPGGLNEGCLPDTFEEFRAVTLLHTWPDGAVWRLETIADDANFQMMQGPHWTAFDAHGHLHAAYAGFNVLRHAVRINAAWHVDDVGVFHMGDGRGDVSLAVGPGDTVHVAAARSGAPTIVWAGLRDGRWTNEGVERSDRVSIPSLAVRPDGRPCVAYVDESDDSRLRYACRCRPF